MKRVSVAIFLGVICFLGMLRSPVDANSSHLSSVKVVSSYWDLTDSDPETIVRILADTGTDFVFWGTLRLWSMEPSTIPTLSAIVSEIKSKLPWIHIMGGTSCSQFPDGDHWPNGTAITNDVANQILWVLPDGRTPQDEYFDWPTSHVVDLTRPMGRQYVLSTAYALIDAGFDSFFCDDPRYIPDHLSEFGLPATSDPYIRAWGQVSSAIKEYAMSKYGREVTVTLNGGRMNALGEDVVSWIWPYQDFISISVGVKTMQTETMQDDWAGLKARIMQVYGYLPPIMVFRDSGKPGQITPAALFAKMSLDDQIKMIRLLHETSLKEGLYFVYPLHELDFLHSFLDRYDAIQQGTYDTIKSLTNTLAITHTLTTSLTYTTTQNVTVTRIVPANPMYGSTYLLAGFAIGAVVVLVLRKKKG